MRLPNFKLPRILRVGLLLILVLCLADCGGSGGGADSSTGSTGSTGGGSSGGGSSDGGSSFGISVKGGALVDAKGNTLQLRGVNVSGLEFVAVQGWSPSDPWGGQNGSNGPDWSAIAAWGANAVRIPLNEASWLGLQCAKDSTALSTLSNADPGSNYKTTVQNAITGANAAGLYVILDLHWSAPDMSGTPLCPMGQNAMASADHAPDFWTSVATTFKSNPAVILELFNEPFVGEWSTSGGASAAARIRDGGTSTQFYQGSNYTTIALNWNLAGMQQLLNAVRATGATNVVLVGTDSWTQQITDAVAYMPQDTLSPAQLGAAWHPYPIYDYGTPQVRCVGLPGCSAGAMSAAAAAVKAGIPVVATEFGDNIASTSGANSPWSQILLPFADTSGISYLGWTWDVWQDNANVLIRDASGTPTYGYGEYVKQHYLCRAAGTC